MKTRIRLSCALVSLAAALLLGQGEDPLTAALDGADETMRDRSYAAAAEAYGEVVRRFPATAGAHRAAFGRMRALFLAGRFPDVLSEGDRYLATAPDGIFSDKVRYLMADAYERTRAHADAARLLAERAEFLAGDAYRETLTGHFLLLADAAFLGREVKDEFGRPARKPDYAQALELYRRARNVRVPPARADEVDLRLAICLAETGAHGDAAQAFLKLLEEHPASKLRADALLRAGRAWFLAGEYLEGRVALEKLRKDFADAPEAPLALQALADQLCAMRGRHQMEGLELYRRFLDAYPQHEAAAAVAFAWPAVHHGEGRYADAEPLWRAFLRRAATHAKAPEARRTLAAGLLAMQRFDDAIAEYSAFLSAHPNDAAWQEVRASIPSTVLAKASALAAEKRTADAIVAYNRFLQEYPDDARGASVLLWIADAHAAASETEAMLRILRACAEKHRGRGEAAVALFRIAAHREGKGELKAAIEQYEELVRLYPQTAEAARARETLAALRAKSLLVASERVFSTKEEALLKVETRNIPKLQARFYRVDLGEYFRKKRGVRGVEGLAVDVVKPEKTAEFDLAAGYEPFRFFARDEKLPVAGAPGAYVVVLAEEDFTATTLAVVSDLRLLVKLSSGQLFAWAFRAETQEPWADVELLVATGSELLACKTGPDGTARLADGRIGSETLVLGSAGGHYAAAGGELAGNAATGYQPIGYVFTDRPLYRPGETVRIGAFLRDVVNGVYAVAAGRPATVVVRDARGVELARVTTATDELGVLEAEAVIDAAAPLGDGEILVETTDRKFRGTFTIAEFRKPEFVVSCDARARVVRPGEAMEATVSASYLVGGRLANAPVSWQLARIPFAFDGARYDSFAWYFADERSSRARTSQRTEVIAQGEARTGPDGTVKLRVETEREAGDATYVLEVTVTDVDRLTAGARLDLFATFQDHFAVVQTDRKAVRAKEEFRVSVTTVDAAHAPAARRGKLLVVRRDAADAPVAAYDVTTGPDGRGEVRVQIEKGGGYRLRYEAGPEGLGRVLAETQMNVQGEELDPAKDARLLAERRFYREGETARLLLDSPVAGATALLTFETDRVLSHRFLRIDAKSSVLEVPLTLEHAPNVFVRIAIPMGRRMTLAGDELIVFRYLDVSVKAQPGAVGPGGECTFTVETRDALGRPVAAAVALSVVDDGIYSLKDDPARGIRKRFYDLRRTLTVATHTSFDSAYPGVTRETNKDLLAEERRRQGGPTPEEQARALVERAREALAREDRDAALAFLAEALKADPNSIEARALLRDAEARDKAKDLRSDDRKRLAEEKGDKLAPSSPPGAREPADEASEMAEESEGADASGLGGGAGGSNKGRGGRRSVTAGGGAAARPLAPGMRFNSLEEDRLEGHFAGFLDGLVLHAVEPPPIRRDFRDTAFFSALRVRTDASGRAEVKVKMPENLTTWRAVARGITATSLVGEAEGIAVTWKDLLVRASAPRFLTDRDESTATSVLHNNTKEKLEATVAVTGEGVVVAGAAGASPVEPGEIQPKDWGLSKGAADRARLIASARAGTLSDAAELVLPVLAYGVPYRDGWAGTVRDRVTIPLDLPATAIPGATHLQVSLAPSLDRAVVEAVAWLEAFPYGCVEQTVHAFFPALAAHRALTRMRSPDAARLARAREVVERGLRRLVRAQNGDGSFGWWRGGGGDPYVTALALWACAEAEAAGYGDASRIKGPAVQALRSLAQKMDDEGRCYVLWAMAAAGDADQALLNRLYRNRFELSASAKALLAMAHERLGLRAQAGELRGMVSREAVRDGDGLHLAGRPEHRWLFSEAEATAYALLAFAAERPLGDDAHAAARWLLAQRRGASFGTTKETGPAALALIAYLEAKGGGGGDGVIVVKLGDDEVGRAEVRRGAMEGRGVLVPAERLVAGRQLLTIEVTGGFDVFYAVRLDAVLRAEKEIEPEGALLKVERRYLPLKAEEGPSGYEIVDPRHRPGPDRLQPSRSRARPGERLTVQVTVTCREPQSYVMIEDPLPAGFEVLEENETGPLSWKERRDTRMVLFAADLPQGDTVFTYRIQAIFPGRYAVLPATAGPMYRPKTYGRTGGASFEISEGAREGGEFELPTPDALWHRAGELFSKKDWAGARAILIGLRSDWRLREEILEELWTRLLRIDLETGSATGIVEAYEDLRTRNPRRLPSGDPRDVLRIGRAYAEAKQFPLAASHFRDVVGLSYGAERDVAATYERHAGPGTGLGFLLGADPRYPEGAAVAETLYGAGDAYLQARRADGSRMLAEGLEAMERYTARFPDGPQAAEAAYRVIGVAAELRRHERAVREAQFFLKRHPKSRYLDDATVFLMAAQFERGAFAEAAAAAGALLAQRYPADRDERIAEASPFRPAAHHVLGKIAHAKGDLRKAAGHYRDAVGIPDAAEALRFLEEKSFSVDPLVRVKVADAPRLPMRFKNVESVSLRIYPVDLFVLFAVRPSLTDLHLVDLTGIAPVASQEARLPGAAPYRESAGAVEVALPEKGKPGAFLVTIKAGDLERSCILLVSDLGLELQESGGKVRAYATLPGAAGPTPAPGVFAKVSDGNRIRASGRTDARGVFEAGGIPGRAAVVAEKEGHYAIARVGG
ncbi:MAG: MG2 domain-containing protein [Planctomycetaceae bacterium]